MPVNSLVRAERGVGGGEAMQEPRQHYESPLSPQRESGRRGRCYDSIYRYFAPAATSPALWGTTVIVTDDGY